MTTALDRLRLFAPLARTIGVAFAALLLTMGMLALSGYDLASCLEAFWQGTFGTRRGWGAMLTGSCPLTLTGLAVALAFRGGALNIGAEGQLLVGTLCAVWFGVSAALPAPLTVAGMFFLACVGGAAWAGIAAVLRIRRGAPEVLTTILLNFVAMELVRFAVTGPIEGVPGTGQTRELPAAARLWMIDRSTDLHAGVFFAFVAAVGLYLLVFRTTVGFELRAVGANPVAAEYAGISVSRSALRTMCLSGALAGLAGTIELTGRIGSLSQGFTTVGYGYTAIAVAMLARLHPLGVLASAWFFAALASGSREMTFAPNYVPDKLVEIVRGLVALLAIGYGVVELRSRKD